MSDTPPVIDSQASFAAAVVWSLQTSIARNARRIVWSDPSFRDWPLDDPALLDALAGWVRLPLRKLVLLAQDFDELPRRHPRFVTWRRSWSHAVEAWSPAEESTETVPALAVDDGPVGLELLDAERWRGRAALDAHDGRRWRERIDALLQQSEPAMPVDRLGL